MLHFYRFSKNLIKNHRFEAESKELKKYIRNSMSQNDDRNLSRHFLGFYEDAFISMFCLSSSILKARDLKFPDQNYPPTYELPTIKLGRLVVDKNFRGKKFGKETLFKAIYIFVDIAKNIGSIGLTVDAKKDSEGFYKKYGFENLISKPEKDFIQLILYTSTLKKRKPSLFENPI